MVEFYCHLETDEMKKQNFVSPKIDLMFQLVSLLGVRIKQLENSFLIYSQKKKYTTSQSQLTSTIFNQVESNIHTRTHT